MREPADALVGEPFDRDDEHVPARCPSARGDLQWKRTTARE
jgi:hypothetical protein